MKKIALLALLAVVMVACSKNQRTVNKLDGTWDVTEFKVTEDGITVDIIEFSEGEFESQWTFEKCKLKDEEFCPFISVTSFGGEPDTYTGLFRVSEDGAELQTKDDNSSTTVESSTIEYISGGEMELTTEDEDGDKTVIVLEKQ